jgi:uncharacterized protein
MSNFTPVSALAGGMLIGASAALLLILNGRIAGISGIIGRLLEPERGEVGWRVAFMVSVGLGEDRPDQLPQPRPSWLRLF